VKLTRSKLRRLIKEEFRKILQENDYEYVSRDRSSLISSAAFASILGILFGAIFPGRMIMHDYEVRKDAVYKLSVMDKQLIVSMLQEHVPPSAMRQNGITYEEFAEALEGLSETEIEYILSNTRHQVKTDTVSYSVPVERYFGTIKPGITDDTDWDNY